MECRKDGMAMECVGWASDESLCPAEHVTYVKYDDGMAVERSTQEGLLIEITGAVGYGAKLMSRRPN